MKYKEMPLKGGDEAMGYRYLCIILTALTLLVFPPLAASENIDPDNDGSQYAWSENAGWLNLEPGGDGGSGVEVSSTGLAGYIWGENIGWISLSCEDSNTCGTVNYGVVNDGNGTLSGYAWAENAGWINFNPTDGGVSIDGNGNFSGYAWGENIGWINFAPITGGGVKTSWRGDADGDGIPDGDGTNPCTGGNTTDCDDNCIDTYNPGQEDTDGDLIGDACDNCREVENGDQRDTNYPDDDNPVVADMQHYGNACDPDFDNDGIVSIIDLNIWRQNVGDTVPPAPDDVDINGDGVIWLQDLAVWRQYYGTPPGPGIGD